jgi:gliding motility-associated-like protein
MKRILFIILVIVHAKILLAQNVNFVWAKQMGTGTGMGNGAYSITVDASGNVYTTGFFTGTIDFDPGPGVFNLVSGSNGFSPDVFISKLNAAGNLIWAKQMGAGTGTGSGDSFSIAVDASGNVYTTGYFTGTVDFDPGPGSYNLNSSAATFISKLNAAGNFVWAKQMLTVAAIEQNRLIAVDASGNVYTTGTFSGTADFDPGTGVFNMTSGNNGQSKDAFISKLDATGNFVWAKQMGGLGPADDASGYTIAVDGSGNVYTTGAFSGRVDFDPGAGVSYLSPGGIFVSKLNAAGNLVWAKQMGDGTGAEGGLSIAVDGSGNVYTTGNFSGTADFDPGAGVFNLSSAGKEDIFVSKLDAAGNFDWAKQIGGIENDEGLSLTVDAQGNVYTTGYFNNSVNFDPGVCTYNFNSFGDDDIFIIKLDAAGNFAWVKQMGGTTRDEGRSIAVDGPGNVYTIGNFSGTADFDPGKGIYNLNSLGDYDIFVHKMSPCANSTSSIITVSACGSYTLDCKTYTSSGVYTQILSNAVGCDSIVTLNLTITSAKSAVTVYQTACSSYLWNGQTLAISGNYPDTLVASNGCDSIVTLHLTILPKSFSNINQAICPGQSYSGYTKSGTYIDTLIAANGCDSIRTLELSVQQKPAPDLGGDKKICPGDGLTLYPGQFSTYLWQDGSTQDSITVKQPGLYSVVVTNDCGSAMDEIVITDGICDIHFPSAFTPNNDGKNDLFKVLGAYNVKDFHIVVFNRLGQALFETTDYTKGWSGNFKGQLQPTGVYVWYCTFKKSNNPQNIVMKGTVTLMR